MDEYYQVVQSLPSWLARPLLDMPSALAPDVQELRLRVGCAPAFTMRGAVCTPQETARELASLQRMLLTPQQMEEILFTLCGGSVHTHQTEIAHGVCDGSLPGAGRALVGVSAKPGTGRRFAGTDLCQPTHCAGENHPAPTGTVCSLADAFHRDASRRRAGQRQNDASAQHGAGACPPEKAGLGDRRAAGAVFGQLPAEVPR